MRSMFSSVIIILSKSRMNKRPSTVAMNEKIDVIDQDSWIVSEKQGTD